MIIIHNSTGQQNAFPPLLSRPLLFPLYMLYFLDGWWLLAQACDCVVELVRCKPESLLKCEMLNAEGVKCTNEVFHTELAVTPTLFLELIGFATGATANLKREWDTVASLAKRFGARFCQFAADEAALDKLWDARRL